MPLDLDRIRAGNPVGVAHTLLGISLTQIAEALGVTPSHISQVNLGRKTLSREHFEAVADLMDEAMTSSMPDSATRQEKRFYEVLDSYIEHVTENLRRQARA